MQDRREVLGLAAAGVFASVAPAALATDVEKKPFYGLIGQMLAAPGKRDELLAILSESTDGMPGCLSYIVAKDAANPDALWITEVWDSPESHKASLQLPQVRAAIAKARPIIAGFPQHFETEPVAGVGR